MGVRLAGRPRGVICVGLPVHIPIVDRVTVAGGIAPLPVTFGALGVAERAILIQGVVVLWLCIRAVAGRIRVKELNHKIRPVVPLVMNVARISLLGALGVPAVRLLLPELEPGLAVRIVERITVPG